jgi:hypothetical protein
MTDDELCVQALAADPDAVVDANAVCLWDLIEPGAASPLPEWYMPSPLPGPRHFRGWRRQLIRFNVGLIIAAFLTINAYGLCNTYGQLHL